MNQRALIYYQMQKEISLSFAKLNELDRRNTVRSILFSLTSTSSEINELTINEIKRKRNLKKVAGNISEDHNNINLNTSTVYSIKGKRVCQPVFSSIVQMHPHNIMSLAHEVGESTVLTVSNNENRRKVRKGKTSLQTKVVLMFLKRYSEVHCLACPTGRGSQHNQPVMLLPAQTTKQVVYDNYKQEWEHLFDSLIDVNNGLKKTTFSYSKRLFLSGMEGTFKLA